MTSLELPAIEALERFVAENDDLLTLEEIIGRFNVFDALGVARAEIRHSRFLAWLLDPGESHGQGDVFLKAVLMDVLRKTPATLRAISCVELDGVELGGVEVRREWPGKTDICISCKSPSLVVAIENKVDAGERDGQLTDYARAVAAQFPGVRAVKVFLTRTGAEPSDESWVVYTYADLYRALSRVRSANTLGGDVGVFLDHYLNLVGSQFMDNPQIVELCRRIYANHRRAIDLINTHAPVAGSEALAPIVEWLQSQQSGWIIRSQSATYMNFIPASWVGEISQPDGNSAPTAPCDMYLECDTWGDDRVRVSARLVVGPPRDRGKRLGLIQLLTSPSFGLRMQRKVPSETYTRLASKTLATWPVDDEVPAEKLATEFAEWVKRLEPHLDLIPTLLATP